MAEVTDLRNNALPYPIYAHPYGVVFPILDNDGDLVTGAANLDSECSLNGDTFADCTNEAVEIATNSGVYYLLLTAAELTADVIAIQIKTSTADAKTTLLTLYPRKLPLLHSGTATAGNIATITLTSSAVPVDHTFTGCVIYLTGGTGAGQTRIISSYGGATRVAVVSPLWAVAPGAGATYQIRTPEGRRVIESNMQALANDSQSATDLKDFADAGYDPATNKVQGVVLTDTCTSNSDMRGTDSAYTGTPPTATAIAAAVWAATTRTLTSFGTLVADIWTYATRRFTQSGVATAAQIDGGTITLTRGDTLTAEITGLGSIATRSKLWFTVKAYPGDPADTAALIQIEETEGLVYINGAAGTAGNGSITVDDEDDGDITVTLAAVESAKLVVRADRVYDIQVLTSAGVETLTSGTFSVVEDVTRATS